MTTFSSRLWRWRWRVLLLICLFFFCGLLLRLPTVGDVLDALHAALLTTFLFFGRIPVRDRRKPVGPRLHEIQSTTSHVRR